MPLRLSAKAGILHIFLTIVIVSSHPAIDLARNISDQLIESASSWSGLGATRMQMVTDRLACWDC